MEQRKEPEKPHVRYGRLLYESSALEAIFEGETGLNKVRIVRDSFLIVPENEIPPLCDRLPAVDYLVEIGVLRKEGELYYYR